MQDVTDAIRSGRMPAYHPWRDLREMDDVEVLWTDLPDGLLALTDGDTIWMERRQPQAQRRSTLAHELAHRAAGHVGCQPPAVEAEVEAAAARRLVPLDALIHAALWARGIEELADDLWVDVGIVHTRLATLTDDERAEYRAALDARGEAP